VADRGNIELIAGGAGKGYKRLPPELWAKVAATVTAKSRARAAAERRRLTEHSKPLCYGVFALRQTNAGEAPDPLPVRDV
jgi:hypothetical protein